MAIPDKPNTISHVDPVVSGWTIETLRVHFDALIRSNDERYMALFANEKLSTKEGFTALKELQNTIYKASEKAIEKSETAQREYNVRSNEFRAQLDDQAKTLLPRNEADARFTSALTISDQNRQALEKLSARVTAIESNGAGMHAMWGYVAAAIGLVLMIASFFINYLKK